MPYRALNPHADKSILSKTNFTDKEVLASQFLRRKRQAKLLSAAAIDQTRKTEVILTIEEQNSCSRIKTGILALCDDRVLLNCGLSIPLNCIHHVQILN